MKIYENINFLGINVVFYSSSCLKKKQSISLNRNDSKDVNNFITPSRPKSKYQTRDILESDVKKTSEHFRNQNIAMVCSKSKLIN